MENTTVAPASSATGTRYPLANDSNGNPLTLPDNAVAWRLRRGGGRRGRPKNVYDASGLQLQVPLAATVETLIEEGCEPDRYQLQPVDAQGAIIPGIIAITEITPEEEERQHETKKTNATDATLMLQMLATIKLQSETLCRALETTTSGYGPVRAKAEAPMLPPPLPPQVIVEAPPPPPEPEGFKPEMMMGVLKTVMDAFTAFGAMPAMQANRGTLPDGAT